MFPFCSSSLMYPSVSFLKLAKEIKWHLSSFEGYFHPEESKTRKPIAGSFHRRSVYIWKVYIYLILLSILDGLFYSFHIYLPSLPPLFFFLPIFQFSLFSELQRWTRKQVTLISVQRIFSPWRIKQDQTRLLRISIEDLCTLGKLKKNRAFRVITVPLLLRFRTSNMCFTYFIVVHSVNVYGESHFRFRWPFNTFATAGENLRLFKFCPCSIFYSSALFHLRLL